MSAEEANNSLELAAKTIEAQTGYTCIEAAQERQQRALRKAQQRVQNELLLSALGYWK